MAPKSPGSVVGTVGVGELEGSLWRVHPTAEATWPCIPESSRWRRGSVRGTSAL